MGKHLAKTVRRLCPAALIPGLGFGPGLPAGREKLQAPGGPDGFGSFGSQGITLPQAPDGYSREAPREGTQRFKGAATLLAPSAKLRCLAPQTSSGLVAGWDLANPPKPKPSPDSPSTSAACPSARVIGGPPSPSSCWAASSASKASPRPRTRCEPKPTKSRSASEPNERPTGEPIADCSSRREEALESLQCEPRYLGCYES